MTPEEFRKNGHAVIDWIVDYMQHDESCFNTTGYSYRSPNSAL